MFLKIAACAVFLSSCAIQTHFSQTAAQPSTNEVRVPMLSTTNAPVQYAAIRSEGISDEVVSLNCVALITAVKIEGNVVTLRGVNHLATGQEVNISKMNRAIYLNGATLKVQSATPDTFTASFQHADVPTMSDRGTALRTDCGEKATLRSNQRVEAFNNNFNFFRQHLASDIELFNYNQFSPAEQDAHYTFSTFNQPSYSWGNNGGWGVQKNRYEELTFNSRGIAQAHSMWCFKHAVGDAACGDYIYASTDGGSTAQSDEGFTVDTRQGGESDKYFHGTVGKGATTGATVLPVTFTSGQQATTDGAFLLDISKGTISGTVSGLDSIVDKTSVHVLPVSLAEGQLTPSTGIGVIQTPLPILAMANVPESITLDVSLIHGAFKPGVACLAGGWYPEQVSISEAAAPNGETQKVTLVHKNPNPTAATDPKNPSSLWQGGPCGNYLSLDRNLARDGFRTSFQVVGATDASHIAYVWNVNGSTRQNGIKLYAAPTPLTNLVRKSGVVTARFAKAGTSPIYNHAPSVVIAGASDSSFNGNVSSPVYDDGGSISLSWKQAGPDATATSATIDLSASSYGFHLYPGAEILAPRTPDGVPLEPNAVAWEPGDVIENPHNPSFQMRFRASGVTQHTPPSGGDSHAELWGFQGAGISLNFRPATWVNNNPCNMYVGCGGTLDPITWTIHHGPYSILHRVDSAPMNGGALFTIGCDSVGCNHPQPYALFVLQNGSISYDPATSTVSTAAFKANKLEAQTANIDKMSFPSNWRGGNGLTVQQSGTASQPIYTIVPETGYYIPKIGGGAAPSSTANNSNNSSAAVISAGTALARGTVSCSNGYQCTADRGRLEVAAAAGSSAGKIAHVQTRLAPGEICTATQNGGTTFLGIGSGGESAAGFDITAAVAISGKTVIDYSCR